MTTREPPTLTGALARAIERAPELAVLTWLALSFAGAADRMAAAVKSMAAEVAELNGRFPR